MDVRTLYDQCCECRYAQRSRGGTPTGCFITGPRIDEQSGKCGDYVFWWTKPPKSEWLKTTALTVGGFIILVGGLLLALIPLIVGGLIRAFLFMFGNIRVNKDNLDLYFPRRRR